jgi:hypothetical protein
MGDVKHYRHMTCVKGVSGEPERGYQWAAVPKTSQPKAA